MCLGWVDEEVAGGVECWATDVDSGIGRDLADWNWVFETGKQSGLVVGRWKEGCFLTC